VLENRPRSDDLPTPEGFGSVVSIPPQMFPNPLGVGKSPSRHRRFDFPRRCFQTLWVLENRSHAAVVSIPSADVSKPYGCWKIALVPMTFQHPKGLEASFRFPQKTTSLAILKSARLGVRWCADKHHRCFGEDKFWGANLNFKSYFKSVIFLVMF
jgi:hypothetical protein